VDEKINHAMISSQEGRVGRAKPTARQLGEEKNIGIGEGGW
jgi:hypothetical protein